MKIAVPCSDGKLSPHFGHCSVFAVADVENGVVNAVSEHVPPPHEPGVLPGWLEKLGVEVILAGGMGARAQAIFMEKNIKVITGAPQLPPEEVVSAYLAGSLQTGENLCDH